MSIEGDGDAVRIVRIRALLVAELHDAAFVAGIHRAAEAVVRAPRGSLVAQDLLADVLGDTYTGTLTWNPERVPLRMHLISEVKRRFGRERRAAARQRVLDDHVAYVDVGEPSSGDVPAHVDPAALLDDVCRRAAGDTEVQQLISLYLEGATRKRHALRHGMSDATYRNARRRLKRLAVAASEATKPKTTRRGSNGQP